MHVNTVMRGVTAVRTAQDYVKLPGYYALPRTEPSESVREYRDEKDFWFDALGYGGAARTLCAGDQIVLRRFRLSPWVPRVPGLYWKAESRRLRAAAHGERLPPGAGLGIYTPVGKTMHILGGVGNVRLLPTASSRLICASSSGRYWQGVPVLVQEHAWRAYDDIPADLEADIRGVWAPMPREHAQVLGGDAGIRRYCLAVEGQDGIMPYRVTRPGVSSAWTLFEHRGPDNRIRYDFAYWTFRVDTSGIDDAIWSLQRYVQEHNGQVLTDFDEEMPHFDALLPVSELMSREVDQRRLRAFLDRVKKRALSSETVRYDRLPQLLMQHFSIEDLRILTLDYLGLELEQLVGPAAGLADHVDALMQFCEEHDRLEELTVGVVQERPLVSDELAVAV